MPITSPIEIKEEPDSTGRLLAREATKVFIVGGGTALALYPGDIILQKLQTQQTVSAAAAPTINTTRSILSRLMPFSVSLSSARILAKGLATSTQSSMVKNATLTQRHKLLNTEERLTEGIEDSSSKKITAFQVISVAGAISFVDTTLNNGFSNKKAWLLHQFLLQKKKVHFQIPQPANFAEGFKTYCAGYPLRYWRNVILVGGLLASTSLEETLKEKTSMSTTQRSVLSATLTGTITGFAANILDIGCKNQIIAIKPDLSVPSAWITFKKLLAEGGVKSLSYGYGTFIFSTVTAYNVIPYMESVATRTIPRLEKGMRSFYQSSARLFSPEKKPSQVQSPAASTEKENTLPNKRK